MLKQKNIKQQEFFSEKLFIATKKLLISYINWTGPIDKFDYFLNKRKMHSNSFSVKSKHEIKQKDPNTSYSKLCITCKKVVGKIYLKCPYCQGKLRSETSVERQVRISKVKIKPHTPKKQKAKVLTPEPLGIEEAKFCEFCGKYSYTASSECPACLRQYRNLVSPQSDIKASHITNISHSVDANSSLSKFEEKQYCAICNAQYFCSTPNTCPYCFNKDKKNLFPKKLIAVKRKTKSDQNETPNTLHLNQKIINCNKCAAKYIDPNGICPYCKRKSNTYSEICSGCHKGLIMSALLPSSAGSKWRKCNFCNLNFEYSPYK